MIFEREALIERAEEKIKKLRERRDRDYDKACEEYEEASTLWDDEFVPELQVFITNLEHKLQTGDGKLTREDVQMPTFGKWNQSYWDRAEPVKSQHYNNRIDALVELIDMLNASTSPAVSQSALNDAGFRNLKDTGIFKLED